MFFSENPGIFTVKSEEIQECPKDFRENKHSPGNYSEKAKALAKVLADREARSFAARNYILSNNSLHMQLSLPEGPLFVEKFFNTNSNI